MNPASPRTLRVTRKFDVSAERVFDAWLDSQKAGKWLFATPTGQMVRVEIDARVGGAFTITERRGNDDIEHAGSYLEIDRPRRLVFTFGVPKFSEQMTKVTVDIVALPHGCELTLTHEGVLPEWAERTQKGWGLILLALAATVDRNSSFGALVEPGTVRFERLLPGPIERVWAYLTESDKRAKWFAGGVTEPRAGGLFELRFNFAGLSSVQSKVPEEYKQFEGENAGPFYTERVIRYEPPRALNWSWDAGIDGPSEVTFELTPQDDKVLLVLTHRRLDPKHLAGVAGGWHTHLAILVDRLADREPGPIWPLVSEMDAEYKRRLG